MNKTVVEKFIIGGTPMHPSMPSRNLQKALGTVIKIDVFDQTCYVPTDSGVKAARKGDTIICYKDGSYDVEGKT